MRELRESQQAQAARLSVYTDTTSTLITALQGQLTRLLTGHFPLHSRDALMEPTMRSSHGSGAQDPPARSNHSTSTPSSSYTAGRAQSYAPALRFAPPGCGLTEGQSTWEPATAAAPPPAVSGGSAVLSSGWGRSAAQTTQPTRAVSGSGLWHAPPTGPSAKLDMQVSMANSSSFSLSLEGSGGPLEKCISPQQASDAAVNSSLPIQAAPHFGNAPPQLASHSGRLGRMPHAPASLLQVQPSSGGLGQEPYALHGGPRISVNPQLGMHASSSSSSHGLLAQPPAAFNAQQQPRILPQQPGPAAGYSLGLHQELAGQVQQQQPRPAPGYSAGQHQGLAGRVPQQQAAGSVQRWQGFPSEPASIPPVISGPYRDPVGPTGSRQQPGPPFGSRCWQQHPQPQQLSLPAQTGVVGVQGDRPWAARPANFTGPGWGDEQPLQDGRG